MNTPDENIAAGCDAADDTLLPVAEAKRRILEQATPVKGTERLGLRDALGRVLAEDIAATMNVPPHANSAMDGYAVRQADLPTDGERKLAVVGRALAGAPFDGGVGPGQCVRIMTGAVMPQGADTVVMQEHVAVEGQDIRVGPGPVSGANVRAAGEDMREGQTVLRAGHRVTPAELGLLASLGIAEVTVRRRIRVAFFSTGDELRGIGQTLQPGQIYDSNRYALYGMLHHMGVEVLDLGVIGDEREALRTAFREAAAVADVVITSGGVSVGEADYVKQTLDELGEVGFWRIAMKPGKPLAVGRLGAAHFFGLPGNPVSVMVTFYQFVRPALQRLMGQAAAPELVLRVPCSTDLRKQPGRLEYQRGILEYDAAGRLTVGTTGGQDSHLLTSMSRANCFVILPAESSGASAGELVEVQPFIGLL
jgi:molybdopterin molybdotransferase